MNITQFPPKVASDSFWSTLTHSWLPSIFSQNSKLNHKTTTPNWQRIVPRPSLYKSSDSSYCPLQHFSTGFSNPFPYNSTNTYSPATVRSNHFCLQKTALLPAGKKKGLKKWNPSCPFPYLVKMNIYMYTYIYIYTYMILPFTDKCTPGNNSNKNPLHF